MADIALRPMLVAVERALRESNDNDGEGVVKLFAESDFSTDVIIPAMNIRRKVEGCVLMTTSGCKENRTTIRRFWDDVWNQKSVAVFEELTTDDFISHGPYPFVMDRTGFSMWTRTRKWADVAGPAGPLPRIVIGEILESGDVVTVRGHWTNVRLADWRKIVPALANIPRELVGIWPAEEDFFLAVHSMEGGKIRRQWLGGMEEAKFALEYSDRVHETSHEGATVMMQPADVGRTIATLTSALSHHEIVNIARAIPKADELEGFIVALGPDWFLLHLLDDGMFLNGYVALRMRDIREVAVMGGPDSFPARALRHYGDEVRRPEGVDLATTASLLRTIGERYPVISIHAEVVEPDACYVGAIVETVPDAVILREISPEATWDEETTRWDVEEITRVDLGGRYEMALTAVGGAPPA